MSAANQPLIQGVVFSKDRALQLEAMLRSFFRHAKDPDAAQMAVLYRASTPQHRLQYAELGREFGGLVRFVSETSFKTQLLEILGMRSSAVAVPSLAPLRHLRSKIQQDDPLSTRQRHSVLFLVDDNIFVRSFRLKAATAALASNPDALGFSMRLGRNTTRSYVLGRAQSLPSFLSLPEAVLKWNWAQADADYGYPLEVSSSIYPHQTLARLLRRTDFTDPNTLESQMFRQQGRFGRHFPALLCFEQSVVFSVPLNRVQKVYKNRAAEADGSSTEVFAEMFDRGQRIKVSALDGFVPSACHEEIGLQFEQLDRPTN